jgi:rubrerythrin
MARKELSAEEKRLKEQKRYTNSHGGPEVRIDAKGKYFCLRCGAFICDEGCSKLKCPGCGAKFDWQKCIIKTPVL